MLRALTNELYTIERGLKYEIKDLKFRLAYNEFKRTYENGLHIGYNVSYKWVDVASYMPSSMEEIKEMEEKIRIIDRARIIKDRTEEDETEAIF